MSKPYYETCPDCGANLDPGEKCDCRLLAGITKHAIQRSKERQGLNETAARRKAKIAWKKGLTHAESRGAVKKYMSTIYFQNKAINRIRIYGEMVYLFADTKLISVVPIPHDLKKAALAQCVKKKERELCIK